VTATDHVAEPAATDAPPGVRRRPPAARPPWPRRAFARLADEVADRVPVPPVDATVAAGRRLTRRRRTTRLVASALLLLAAAALAGGALRPSDPAAPAAVVSRAATPFGPVVSFADPRHGYAYVGRCPPADACAVRLYATGDGGDGWRRIANPVQELRPAEGVVLRALDTRTVLIENGDERWISRDRGRTWRRPAAGPAAPLPAVPTGGRPFLRCAQDGSNAPCPGVRLMAEDPRDGLAHPLAASPPQPLSGVSLAADGTLWSVGVEPVTSRAVVGRSADRGLTWSVDRVSLRGLYGVSVRISAVDGRRAFIVVSANRSGWFASQFAALYATVDGGRTWAVAERRGMPYRSYVDALALPTGRLVVLDPRGAALVSDDAGASFVQTVRLPRYAGVERVGGLIVARTDNGSRVATSVDGVRWTAIRLPGP
jgi:photosystem II stability/assembly factor-like uncharacterized protein